jgi:hypothetical protein
MKESQAVTLIANHTQVCSQCRFVAQLYRKEFVQVMATADLPDELASRIRATLCKEGQRVFDQVLGVWP